MARRITRPDGTRVLSLREGGAEDMAEIAAGEFDLLSIHAGTWDDFHALAQFADRITKLAVSGPVKTYAGLEKLTRLTGIDLEDAPSPALDLLAFQALECCHLVWHKRYPEAFFELPRLRDVTLTGYSAKDCAAIGRARGLQRLDLRKGSVERLDGLEGLTGLRHLSLAYLRNLQDVSAAARLAHLETLHIEKCPKLENIGFVRELRGLRNLFLDCGGDGFADLQWLSGMNALVDLLIAVPVQAVDWNVVFALPELQRVVVNTHPGYAIDDAALFATAAAHGRTLDNYGRAGTKQHPAFKFWMNRRAG